MMTNCQRVVIELSQIVQPGDLLTCSDGTRETAASLPYNQAKYRRGNAWICSIKTSWGYCPMSLGCVTMVERDGRIVWDVNNERVPIQQALF